MNDVDVSKLTLPNGVRIVTERMEGVQSVALGIWVGAGSRLENGQNSGVSHFIEHLMFKGTGKRTAKDIAEALDGVGGQMNAFTSKECTCYYTRTLDEHFDLALDVLSDMFFNSAFKQEAIDMERGVVEEEIRMYEDTPDDLIHDLLVQTAWPDHPLGRPILGTLESLGGIRRAEILDYIGRAYVPDRVVVAAAGRLEHEEIQQKIRLRFESMKQVQGLDTPAAPAATVPVGSNQWKDTEQIQLCLGVNGLKVDDADIYSLHVLNNVLGGGLSSRLVQSIREERGLAYSVYSYHSAFCDTGLFALYAGTSPSKYQEVLDLLLKELESLVEKGITQKELEKAQEQIKGSLILGLESASSRMSRLGKNELALNRMIPPSEVVERVSAVTLEGVRELAGRLFREKKITVSTIGRLEEAVRL
ncbi:MAG: insulinase family protein [Peptococcaceae bacterium]|nr:insulinase family protein [Peptococcaceae bacterium]